MGFANLDWLRTWSRTELEKLLDDVQQVRRELLHKLLTEAARREARRLWSDDIDAGVPMTIQFRPVAWRPFDYDPTLELLDADDVIVADFHMVGIPEVAGPLAELADIQRSWEDRHAPGMPIAAYSSIRIPLAG